MTKSSDSLNSILASLLFLLSAILMNSIQGETASTILLTLSGLSMFVNAFSTTKTFFKLKNRANEN